MLLASIPLYGMSTQITLSAQSHDTHTDNGEAIGKHTKNYGTGFAVKLVVPDNVTTDNFSAKACLTLTESSSAYQDQSVCGDWAGTHGGMRNYVAGPLYPYNYADATVKLTYSYSGMDAATIKLQLVDASNSDYLQGEESIDLPAQSVCKASIQSAVDMTAIAGGNAMQSSVTTGGDSGYIEFHPVTSDTEGEILTSDEGNKLHYNIVSSGSTPAWDASLGSWRLDAGYENLLEVTPTSATPGGNYQGSAIATLTCE